jgi:glyoxylase-like metal-dependent hydrolase (beta-lactamase superfamily II)
MATGSARVHILHEGYVREDDDGEHVGSPVTLITDLWQSRDADGARLSPSIRLMATPGHTEQDISTIADTAEGSYVCTHAWWSAGGPADDPFSPDQARLSTSRQQILGIAAVIIPGHGPSFRPGQDTPR